jgi:mannosyltransferase OCH1-like enzyme
MIPQKIHYIWLGRGIKNLLIQKCIKSWYLIHPDWEINLWNEDNLPLNHPYVKSAFEAKQYAFAADYLRFWVLNSHGGVYLDTDMELIKPLNSLMQNDAFMGYESVNRISAGIIAGCVENLYFQKVLKEYDLIAKNNKFEIICDVLTRIHCSSDPIKIMPIKYFYPYNPYSRNPMNRLSNLLFLDISEETHAIHHWNKSWSI